jgi:hypothetical protein
MGIGALPLLRHLILVDEKSSTYKIALLRIIARIADTAAGSALHDSEGVVLQLIRLMPAKYLQWPASDRAIFEIRLLRRTAPPESLTIDETFLWSFGEFLRNRPPEPLFLL